jgi:hypothetical protein
VRKGLIRDVGDKVREIHARGVDLFEAPHNRAITWDHLLRQTSDWQGTLWGKPDWADRPEESPTNGPGRKLHRAGTRYKYNDVRVNVLALARAARAAPAAARGAAREVMDPIGASSTWRWHGYETRGSSSTA